MTTMLTNIHVLLCDIGEEMLPKQVRMKLMVYDIWPTAFLERNVGCTPALTIAGWSDAEGAGARAFVSPGSGECH